MPTDTGEKLLLQALKGQRPKRAPFWLMRQAGRHLPEYRELRAREPDFLKFCYSPALAVEAALQPLRRYACDGAILFSDILVVPDALGRKVTFEEKIGPVLEPIRTAVQVPGYDRGKMLKYLSPVFETLSRLSEAVTDDVAVIGFAGAPWTVAVYMVEGRGGTDHSAIKSWALDLPLGFDPLIKLLIDATADYLIEQVKHGAEVLQLFDTWAGVLTDEQYRRWVIAPTAEIVGRIKTVHPAIPIIGFPRGSVGDHFKLYAEGSGVDAVGIDPAVSLHWAKTVLQPLVAVQGNLDNKLLVTGGKAMEQATEEILQVLGGGRFVFNLGHGILPETPPENVAVLAARLRME